MATTDDRDYFRRRESVERTLAAHSADPAAAQAHRAMAERYASLCTNGEQARPTLSLVHS